MRAAALHKWNYMSGCRNVDINNPGGTRQESGPLGNAFSLSEICQLAGQWLCDWYFEPIAKIAMPGTDNKERPNTFNDCTFSINLYHPNLKTKINPVKNYLIKLLPVLVVLLFILSACSSSRETTHHRGVNNKAFRGYWSWFILCLTLFRADAPRLTPAAVDFNMPLLLLNGDSCCQHIKQQG